MRRALMIGFLAVATAVTAAGPAGAIPRGGVGSGGDEIDVWVGDSGNGSGGGGGSGCSSWRKWLDVTPNASPEDVASVRVIDGVIHNLFYRECSGKGQWLWVPELTGIDVARIAYNEAKRKLPAAVLGTIAQTDGNPESWTFVQLPTWFWTDAATWAPIEATASIPGLSATVRATPTVIRFDPGDGTGSIECAGPGRVFDTSQPNTIDEPNGCSHIYRHSSATKPSGAYATSLSVVWEVTYSATDNTSGRFDPLIRTTSQSLEVAEMQALVIAGP